MARFLTPSKIGLLALIELYTQDVVPTASIIPILCFVLNQLLPSTAKTTRPQLSGSVTSLPFILTLETYETLLSAYPAASGFPGRTLWDQFLHKLWKIDSLNALHDFFDKRTNLLAQTNEENKRDGEMGIPPPDGNMIFLSRTSPFGSFVRRSKVEFERLRFSDALALWITFCKWRQGTQRYYSRKVGHLGRWAGDKALEDGERVWGVDATEMLETVAYGIDVTSHQEGCVSTDDVEKLLEFQVEQMQKFGNRIPYDVKESFRKVLEDSIMVPSLSHYLDFLDAWRAGDYPTSFDTLHRYFDYTMQNRDRLFYQYALMNLAVLQADFGCFDEAVAAMLETVSTARENKDMACLNFALNWLYHFGKAHPKMVRGSESSNMLGVEREGLAFLRIKAKETGMWTLWSSSLLSEAKLGMSSGESIATSFENILKSSSLIVEKNMKSMMGPQMAMNSSLWGRLGVANLSRQYCEIFLSCHARYALFDDSLRFTCRIAHLLTEKGRYDDAMEKLDSLDENCLRSWKANQYWLEYRGILRLKSDLHRNNLDRAEQLLSQLLQFNGSESDPDLGFEINNLHIDYLIRRTDFAQALAKVEQMASAMKEAGDDINLRVKLLCVKALLHANSGRPEKGFSVAIRAASIAWRARLIPALWAAMGAIANILNSLREYRAACSILVAIIPRALECENCSLNAQLYTFLVDSHMGMAGKAEGASLVRKHNLTMALEYLDRAFNEYSAVTDIRGQNEIMAKKATIMRVVGEKVLGNDYASAYLDLKMEAARERK